MAKLVYIPTRSNLNENGNPEWAYKGEESVYNVINYILDPDVPVLYYSSLGVPFGESCFLSDSFIAVQCAYKQAKGRRIRHEVFILDSKEEYTDPYGQDRLLTIAYACAAYYYRYGFKTVFSIWASDKDKKRNLPEIHFAVNTVSLCDGHKYHINAGQLRSQEMYFQDLAAYITGKMMDAYPVIPDLEEPDYSYMLYYPNLTDLQGVKYLYCQYQTDDDYDSVSGTPKRF